MKKFMEVWESMSVLRRELVIPYLKKSEQLRSIMRVDENGDLWEKNNKYDSFPWGLKDGDNGLMAGVDACFKITYEREADNVIRNFPAAVTEKECFEYESTQGYVQVSYSNNRTRCKDYLLAIARDSYDAEKMFCEDDNPYTLIIAITALEVYLHGKIREEIKEAMDSLFFVKLVEAKTSNKASCG